MQRDMSCTIRLCIVVIILYFMYSTMSLTHVCYALEIHSLLLYIQWHGLHTWMKWGLGFLGVNIPLIKICALFSSCEGAFCMHCLHKGHCT